MIEKRTFDKKVAICSRLKIIFFNIDLIKLFVGIFKLTVNGIILFLLNQKIKKNVLKKFKIKVKIFYLSFSTSMLSMKYFGISSSPCKSFSIMPNILLSKI